MELKHLTDENFEFETNKENLVAIDFFATWCGPCKIFGPIVEKTAEEMKDVNFYKVDVDQSERVAREFGIMSIPTLVLIKNNKEIARNVGLMNHDDLVDFIKEYE